MKRVLVVIGGGRKNGNTEQLADSFIRGAKERGHHVTKANLSRENVNGCNGCNACKSGKGCIQKDYISEIYQDYIECDTLVLASPLYYWSVTARTKAFLERLYADDLEYKKDCLLLMTAAYDTFWTFEQAVSYYRFNCINYLGWKNKGMVLAGGCGDAISKFKVSNKYLEKSYFLGKSI